LIIEKLRAYNIDLANITSICTDGGKNMIKVSKDLQKKHLVCFAHFLNNIMKFVLENEDFVLFLKKVKKAAKIISNDLLKINLFAFFKYTIV